MAKDLARSSISYTFILVQDVGQWVSGSVMSSGVAAAAAVVNFWSLVVNLSDPHTGFFSRCWGRCREVTASNLAQRQATQPIRIGALSLSGDFWDGERSGVGGFVEVTTDHTRRQTSKSGASVGDGDFWGVSGSSVLTRLDGGNDTVDCGLDERKAD